MIAENKFKYKAENSSQEQNENIPAKHESNFVIVQQCDLSAKKLLELDKSDSWERMLPCFTFVRKYSKIPHWKTKCNKTATKLDSVKKDI